MCCEYTNTRLTVCDITGCGCSFVSIRRLQASVYCGWTGHRTSSVCVDDEKLSAACELKVQQSLLKGTWSHSGWGCWWVQGQEEVKVCLYVCVYVQVTQRWGEVRSVLLCHVAVIKDDRFAVRGVRLYLPSLHRDASLPLHSASILLLPCSRSASTHLQPFY